MSKERKRQGKNQSGRSKNIDNLSTKRQRITEDGMEKMHCQQIAIPGMGHKDFQIEQLNQKVAFLKMQLDEQNKQLQNELKHKDLVEFILYKNAKK